MSNRKRHIDRAAVQRARGIGLQRHTGERGRAGFVTGEDFVPGALNLAAILAARATPKWLLRRVSGAMVRRMK